VINHRSTPTPPNPRSFAQSAAIFGIHPLVALVAFVVDQMLFAGELATGFVLTILSFFVGLALMVPCVLLQRRFGDPWGAAVAKGALVAIVTMIPTGLPTCLLAGLGYVGSIGLKHRRTVDATGDEVNADDHHQSN